MTNNESRITIHMVSSLDGIIAKKDNSVSWFETVDNFDKGVTQAAEDSTEKIDCYVMGSKTYEHAVELSKSYGWVYGETPTVVLTHRNLPNNRQNVEMYSGDLQELVQQHLKPKYRNIWVVGGAIASQEFLRLRLADEIRLSIIPIVLGDGLPFLGGLKQEVALHVKDVTAYKNGIVELRYEIKK